MIDGAAVVSRAPGVLHRQLADGGGLFDPDGNACHRLNESGALIWALLAEPIPFGQLQQRVAASIAEPPEGLHAEVEAFVEELRERRLVDVSDGRA